MKVNQRIHGIDALRAIAMISGIFLHATIAFKTISLPAWPQDLTSSHWSFDYAYFFIHSFRMPLFFLIAGYFCRFLFIKVGEKQFILHRFKRIVIPFLASMVVILPLTIFPFLVYHFDIIQPHNSWQKVFGQSLRQLLHWNGMAHLWFLYYLIIYYFVVVAVLRIANLRFLKKISSFVSERLGQISIGNSIGLVTSVTVLTLILWPESRVLLHVDTGIIPNPLYLIFFGFFFLIGWLANANSTDFFTRAIKSTWWLLTIGTTISVLVFYIDFHDPSHNHSRWLHFVLKLFAACQIIMLVYGSIGFFLKYFIVENRFWKYISDASYWMYLIHLMIVAALQVLFLNFKWHALIKFTLILMITLAITLVTYQFWIRYTYIGTLLHGKREKLSR